MKRCSRGCQKISATLTMASCRCADTTSMSSLSRATSLRSSVHEFIDRPVCGAFPPLLTKLRTTAARCKPPAHAASRIASKRYAGRPYNDADRALMEFALVGRHDGVELGLIVGVAGQHDFDPFGRFAHRRAARGIAPLPGRIGDRQAVGKARRQLAGD